MKRYLIYFLLIVLFSLTFLEQVIAHGATFSAIEVNGEAARANPFADEASPSQLAIAKDLSPRTYQVGEKISFSLNPDLLPEHTPSKSYQWEFAASADLPVVGPAAEGLRVSYRYTKPGTYLIFVGAKQPTESHFTRFTSLELSVTPTKDYVMPGAAVLANGKPVESLLLDTIEIRSGKPVTFDASATGTIVSYQWDFGDGSGASGKTVTHIYNKDTFFPMYALLRATDENGLTADAYGTLDTPLTNPNPLMSFLEAIREFFTNLFTKKR